MLPQWQLMSTSFKGDMICNVTCCLQNIFMAEGIQKLVICCASVSILLSVHKYHFESVKDLNSSSVAKFIALIMFQLLIATITKNRQFPQIIKNFEIYILCLICLLSTSTYSSLNFD